MTADDAQAAAARPVIETGDIFIPTTLLLEAEWVLRSGYGFSSEAIWAALTRLAGLPGVAGEDPLALASALDGLAGGMYFADAPHLARADGSIAFLSFDLKLAKAAKGRSSVPAMVP
ncbi:type II toxin-antitoxin system VapC family toxin [Novosphingobium sp. AAP93]|uniref:type II toxin-antitoxin system VapC family toxin n=1 Tax=Novosphingobium sp. AAP93 TaxID=1523427 RepID=UPI001E5D484F|nr:type II toxin-antitoxin system VapC family toxin [Novosphingobium sp. AAP93]